VNDTERERLWAKGEHENGDGRLWALERMTNAHLQNTISLFSHLNTTPLQKELRRSGRDPVKWMLRMLKRHALQRNTQKQRRRAALAAKARKALKNYLKQKT
jgi:hypothetical protein